MFPISKVPKQSLSLAMMERRKRDREKERTRLSSKKKLPADAKSRFGKEFIAKLCELFQSEEPGSFEKMREMHNELAAYYKEHDLNVMWISDDDGDNKEIKAPLSKKMHQDLSRAEIRFVSAPRPKLENKERLKPKIDSKNVLLSSTPVSSSLLSQFELSDDSDDNSPRKTWISHTKSYRLCDTCSGATSVPNNMILECEECGKTLHQKCARPEITPLQARDPRFLFVCSDCKGREDEKAGSNSSKPTLSVIKKDDRGGAGGGVQKVEEKIVPLRPENDILITFSNFAAKKGKKPVSSVSTTSAPSAQGNSIALSKVIPSFGAKDRK